MVLGHEITGEVIECGKDVEYIKNGDLCRRVSTMALRPVPRRSMCECVCACACDCVRVAVCVAVCVSACVAVCVSACVSARASHRHSASAPDRY
jgi:hypothetical protein